MHWECCNNNVTLLNMNILICREFKIFKNICKSTLIFICLPAIRPTRLRGVFLAFFHNKVHHLVTCFPVKVHPLCHELLIFDHMVTSLNWCTILVFMLTCGFYVTYIHTVPPKGNVALACNFFASKVCSR